MRFKLLSLICCFLIATTVLPVARQMAFGATRDVAELQGKEDAKADAELLQHCAIGCLLPFISMVSEEILPPRPPAHRLLGKSPMYVQYYTEAYQQHIRYLRRNALLVGSLVGITSVGGCIVFLFSAWS